MMATCSPEPPVVVIVVLFVVDFVVVLWLFWQIWWFLWSHQTTHASTHLAIEAIGNGIGSDSLRLHLTEDLNGKDGLVVDSTQLHQNSVTYLSVVVLV